MRYILVAVLPALFLVACLPESKTGCRTTDDCVSGRVCVAGTCQYSLDASADSQFLEKDSTTVDRPENPVYPDAGGPDEQIPGDVAADHTGRLGSDSAAQSDDGLDSATAAIDQAADAPMVDAFDSLGGMDNGTDRPFPADVPTDPAERANPDSSDTPDLLPDTPDLLPDLGLSTADVALEAPTVPTIDAMLSDSLWGDVDTSDAAAAGAGDLITEFTFWKDFRARCPREPWPGGRYIVDGDLVFDEVGLQGYYDAWFAAEGAAQGAVAPLGNHTRWPFPDSMSISYCISTNFGDSLAVVEAAMAVATASWSARAGVQYTYMPDENVSCDANNSNVTFDVRPVSGAGYAAASFFPDSPRSAQSLLVDTSTLAAGPNEPGLDAALRHQLGHTLGFQHERLWLDPGCTTEDGRLAVKIADYDVDSVMHLPACRPSEIGGTVQTEGDLVGAVATYGLAPALTAVITM